MRLPDLLGSGFTDAYVAHLALSNQRLHKRTDGTACCVRVLRYHACFARVLCHYACSARLSGLYGLYGWLIWLLADISRLLCNTQHTCHKTWPGGGGGRGASTCLCPLPQAYPDDPLAMPPLLYL